MSEKIKIKETKDVVVRFSGDSGDGMQLSGTIFSNLSAILGNQISTFPDYPAEIRAPQGSLSGVSGFQIHLGVKIFTSGDKADVLVAMNPAALKVNANHLKTDAVVIIDSDSFKKTDLDKALFKTDDPFGELGLKNIQILSVPITTLTKESLADFDIDNKARIRSKNMFALGLTCWLFNRPLDDANHMLATKFSKKPKLVDINTKALVDGYNYGYNASLSVKSYCVETTNAAKGFYTSLNGNTATAYGLIAAAEQAKKQLFLGSYPITPATDIMHELTKHKELGIKVVQAEDEIAGICSAIGASFAGCLAVTNTSGPGLALKGEAIGLAVMTELPLVIVDVQRGGPSTGLPTKSEQTDLNQALYGRNGESPLAVIAATSPTNCFDSAFWASKIALEHITPVILLTDAYIANGSSAWKIPDMKNYPTITPHDQTLCKEPWTGALRDQSTLARYWAAAGTKDCMHRVGGLEKDYLTGAISTDPANHEKMVGVRQEKIARIADSIPELEVLGNTEADLLIVGWGGTYGHLREAIERMNEEGTKVAFAHFQFINPLPKNTKEVLCSYKRIIVAEQNTGQFANYLRNKIQNLPIFQYNKVEGQPFVVEDLIAAFKEIGSK